MFLKCVSGFLDSLWRESLFENWNRRSERGLGGTQFDPIADWEIMASGAVALSSALLDR